MTKYALITGASRGLGKAIALRLANDGFAVIINYQSNKEAAEDTLKQIQDAGGKGELLPFNVADPQAIETALDSWSQAHPDDYISVLVNNAGIRQDNLMIFMQEEQWNKVLDTTLNGFFYITRRLLKDMMTHRNGRIINTKVVLIDKQHNTYFLCSFLFDKIEYYLLFANYSYR